MKEAKEYMIELALKHNKVQTEKEIREDFDNPKDEGANFIMEIIEQMKQYGHDCAKQALEDAANMVRFCEKGDPEYDYDYPVISKQSILDTEIKTP